MSVQRRPSQNTGHWGSWGLPHSRDNFGVLWLPAMNNLVVVCPYHVFEVLFVCLFSLHFGMTVRTASDCVIKMYIFRIRNTLFC